MSRGVRKVRQSIERRKKLRGLPAGKDTEKEQHVFPAFLQEEEKHGVYPDFSEEGSVTEKNEHHPAKGMAIRAVISALLFAGTAFIIQTDAELFKEPKNWTTEALTEEFPFAKVNVWYQDTFGGPMQLSPQPSTDTETVTQDQLTLPVSGSVKESFQTNGKGIKIAPGEETGVAALEDGVVVFAGKDRDTEQTVIIQHPDGSKSTYGFLSALNVHLYQFVERSQKIGSFSPVQERESMYFSIENKDNYVDPVQVIKVDDTP
ncbi:peptidoglycan DD-metalloendopeptidase family protein [Virgibacillus xinjiangensis]|uniref:Peptidoglycan DD-metalloendopeptidase family protein n=1 Tax=Virgibacillus xinjiangensis TaxID=393090 RepID=A0ABV7CSG6_9BACI